MKLRTGFLVLSLQYLNILVQCKNGFIERAETDIDYEDLGGPPADFRNAIPDLNLKKIPEPSLRIIGGTDADVEEYKWAARIFEVGNPNNHRHWCGGAMIAQHFIITAAHCARTFKPECNGTARNYNIEVVVNRVHYRNPRVFTYKYNDCDQIESVYADIALLQVPRVNFRMTEIDLPYSKEKDHGYFGKPGMVIGWGRTLAGDTGSAAAILQKLPVNIEHGSHDRCKFYQNDIDTTICLISSNVSGPCKGDSGGPLFTIQPEGTEYAGTPILLGVTSWGDNPCDTIKPVIYTRIFSFMIWIVNTVNGNKIGTHPSELKSEL